MEDIVRMGEGERVRGEEMRVLEVEEVRIVGGKRKMGEGGGKVNVDFVVRVGGRVIDEKWEVEVRGVG